MYFCHSLKKETDQQNVIAVFKTNPSTNQVRVEKKKRRTRSVPKTQQDTESYVSYTDGWVDSRLLIWVIIMITSYNPCDQQEGI